MRYLINAVVDEKVYNFSMSFVTRNRFHLYDIQGKSRGYVDFFSDKFVYGAYVYNEIFEDIRTFDYADCKACINFFDTESASVVGLDFSFFFDNFKGASRDYFLECIYPLEVLKLVQDSFIITNERIRQVILDHILASSDMVVKDNFVAFYDTMFQEWVNFTRLKISEQEFRRKVLSYSILMNKKLQVS